MNVSVTVPLDGLEDGLGEDEGEEDGPGLDEADRLGPAVPVVAA
ncbi:hypothetical protein GCM10025734_82060 [Kitasatospora paranensis]